MENYVFIFFVFLKTQLHKCYQKKAFIFFNPFLQIDTVFLSSSLSCSLYGQPVTHIYIYKYICIYQYAHTFINVFFSLDNLSIETF